MDGSYDAIEIANAQYSYVFFKNIQHSNYTTFVCVFQMFLRFFFAEAVGFEPTERLLAQ